MKFTSTHSATTIFCLPLFIFCEFNRTKCKYMHSVGCIDAYCIISIVILLHQYLTRTKVCQRGNFNAIFRRAGRPKASIINIIAQNSGRLYGCPTIVLCEAVEPGRSDRVMYVTAHAGTFGADMTIRSIRKNVVAPISAATMRKMMTKS